MKKTELKNVSRGQNGYGITDVENAYEGQIIAQKSSDCCLQGYMP